jgi:hypothetical protein
MEHSAICDVLLVQVMDKLRKKLVNIKENYSLHAGTVIIQISLIIIKDTVKSCMLLSRKTK